MNTLETILLCLAISCVIGTLILKMRASKQNHKLVVRVTCSFIVTVTFSQERYLASASSGEKEAADNVDDALTKLAHTLHQNCYEMNEVELLRWLKNEAIILYIPEVLPCSTN